MQDADIVARFDGRPTVKLTFSGFQTSRADRAVWIGSELGYELDGYESYGRGGDFRLTLTRDDSPPARRRAMATLARMQSTGSWLPYAPPWVVTMPYDPAYIHPERAARVRRNLKAYEGWHPSQLIISCCVAAAVLLPFAWLARSSLALTVLAIVGGFLCLTAAVIGPRYIKNWQRKNLELLERFRQQQAAQFPVPPPPPAANQGRSLT
ncbi:hypothetical protein AB0C96_37685 [Streptomyces sp. NPDC048506]|uniref:hypothetical protein n=1 Tax=Streptomyces sp. NPDC048506 TaxID=3155028 RepID=UPI003419488F